MYAFKIEPIKNICALENSIHIPLNKKMKWAETVSNRNNYNPTLYQVYCKEILMYHSLIVPDIKIVQGDHIKPRNVNCTRTTKHEDLRFVL